jgi:hypothetical protein
VAPVDGLFYRGQFWFGSSPESVRFRHIRQRPSVSGTHTRGESMAVIVHGHATIIQLATADIRQYLLEVYGGQWDDWGADATYARIEASRMYAFSFADAVAPAG